MQHVDLDSLIKNYGISIIELLLFFSNLFNKLMLLPEFTEPPVLLTVLKAVHEADGNIDHGAGIS